MCLWNVWTYHHYDMSICEMCEHMIRIKCVFVKYANIPPLWYGLHNILMTRHKESDHYSFIQDSTIFLCVDQYTFSQPCLIIIKFYDKLNSNKLTILIRFYWLDFFQPCLIINTFYDKLNSNKLTILIKFCAVI